MSIKAKDLISALQLKSHMPKLKKENCPKNPSYIDVIRAQILFGEMFSPKFFTDSGMCGHNLQSCT